MHPQDFFLEAFSQVAPIPFNQDDLFNSDCQNRLALHPGDKTSLLKFRVSATSMILFLSYRAIREKFAIQFGISPIIFRAEALGDVIVEQVRVKTVVAPWIDEKYFPLWRSRYEAYANGRECISLKHAALVTCIQQCTFSYELEPFVRATEDALIGELDFIFETFVPPLRKLFGEETLQVFGQTGAAD